MNAAHFHKIIFHMLTACITGGVCIAQQSKPSNTTAANIQRDSVYTADSVYVIADAGYKKKGTRRWLLGDHYRKEWIAPVKVPVVDLGTFQGGLTAKKEGGGKQTQSLRLQSTVDGEKQYVIRSIEKYPDKAIPQEFAGTFVSEFVKDQVSSANPFAPLVVAKLAEAAGIFHTNPKMVFVAHSPRLGVYDSAFGNRFYLLEERPDGNWNDAPFFGYSKRLISSENLMPLLIKAPSYRVDQAAFLRARLLDILIGDWDRHEDQWAWAGFDEGEEIIFRPIPKDRDQAFAKLDGVLPWLGSRKWAVRRAQHFGEKIRDLPGLVWSARNIDRALLNELIWSDWQVQVKQVLETWTDEVIEAAVRQLPDTIYNISGEQIKQKLIRRRNDLASYALQHYKALAIEVEWVGTNSPDIFIVQKMPDCSVLVKQFAVFINGNKLVRQRLFDDDTKEIRIYGLKEDDIFRIDSSNHCGTRIRIIGGEGKNSYSGGNYKNVLIYDDHAKQSHLASSATLKRKFDSLTHEYRYKTHQYNTFLPVILPGYNPDDGLFIGGGILLTKQKWGHAPFAQQHFIAANRAFKTSAYNFWYEGLFTKVFFGWDVYAAGKLNQPNYVLNFYGLGNNTELATKDRDYNRVRVKQAVVSLGIQRKFNNKHEVIIRGEFMSTRVESADKRFVSLNNSIFDSLDFDRTHWAGSTAGYSFSTIDNSRFPSKGITCKTSIRYLYSGQRKDHLLNNESSVSVFIPLGRIVFASRLGGAVLSGDPQFFQYNQLGGTSNLRGFWRSRFSGKSSLYNNNEIRIPIADIKGYIIRGKIGISAFCDNGRVWIQEESSGRWHAGYGAGLWVIPFGRLAFTAHYGISEEDKIITVRTGFLF